MDNEEKTEIKKLLERYGSKDRNLEDREYRILQGVIKSNFGLDELIKKQKSKLEKAKKEFKLAAQEKLVPKPRLGMQH